MCSESRDIFKGWKIGDNISLTVQDRDISIGKLITDRMWPIEWHHYQ